MNEDRWRRIEELYHAARLLNDSARASFLAAATEGDEELRREVESLLISGASSPGFLDQPVQTEGAAMRLADAASLSGRRIGTYSIHERIGAGGMGEVYRAHDSKLRRDVAFKVLAADLIGDNDQQRQDHLRRFRQEAHALAALNHPNIAAIYGLEEADGVTALVMELVEGSTLADRIMQGAIPLEETLPIATQIAEALEAAHERGIVHRDLKPANIKLRADGTVKVLDFGLAKHTAGVGGDDATRSLNPAVTEVGMVVGTPAYMAPEQVQGKESDSRADLFAFGLVLYEMVTTRLPFPGASLGSMLASGSAAVIDPPCQGRSRIAPRLNGLILRLLERDPARRPKSAAAVRHELLEIGHATPVRTATLVAAGAGVMVLAAALWWSSSSRAPARRWPEVSGVTMITTYAGNESTPSISPDGTMVAFSWAGEDGGHQGIYVTASNGQEEPHQLTRNVSPDTRDVFPAWSPDRAQIAFVRRHGATSGDIVVIPARGGPERILREIRFVAFPAFSWLAWTPDGAQIAFASQSLESGRSTVFLMRLEDGRVRSLTAPPNGVIGDASPAFSPDGRSLAFVRWSSPSTSTLLVQTLSADMQALGEPVTVPAAANAPRSPAWVDNKRLLFAEQSRILEWEAGAAPEQIYVSSARLAGLAIAGREAGKTPSVVAAQQNDAGSRIWTIPLRTAGVAGGPPEPLSRFGNGSNNPDYSPDGKHIVFVSRRSGTPELWMTDGDGGNLTQLTRLGVQSLGTPRWSPDSRHIAFFARVETEEPQIYVIDATQDRPVLQQATHQVPGCNIPSWSLSGKHVYCSRLIEGEMRLFRIPAESGRIGEPEIDRWFEGKSATETSDGRVLYIKNNRQGLFARSLAGDPKANPEDRLVEDIRGPYGYFAAVADGVYYTGQDSSARYVGLRFFDYARRRSVDVAPTSITGQINSLTVTPDGTRLVYTQVRRAGIDLTRIQFR